MGWEERVVYVVQLVDGREAEKEAMLQSSVQILLSRRRIEYIWVPGARGGMGHGA